MNPSYIQSLFAERIGGQQYGKTTVLYKFEKIKREKAAAQTANPKTKLIDMGVGEPDEMAFPQVVHTLQQAAAKPEYRSYADNGGPAFKAAAAAYMKTVFDADLDPHTEILHSIGSKAALTLLPACFINPGDTALMTTPGYPIFGTHSRYYGGEVYPLPLTETNGFLPDLNAIPNATLQRAKVLVLNYPNNPTGACATPEFFKEVVAFAKAHQLVVIHDAAYASLVYEGQQPLSILQIPGGKDVAVELHSLSKSYNMTGWRIGFVAGNALIVRAYGDVKDNSDSGQFLSIQQAAITALKNPWMTQQMARKYSRRFDGLVAALHNCGFQATIPKAGFFLYTRVPRAVTLPNKETEIFKNAAAFSQWLLLNALISTVPWDEAGPYVRFSATFVVPTLEAEQAIIQEIENRLSRYTFQF